MAKLLLCISILYSIALPISTAQEAGGIPTAIMQSGAGARSQGLGNATVAVFDATPYAYCNPGAMSLIKEKGFNAGGSLLSIDRKEGYLSYKHNIKHRGAFGVSWISRGDLDIDIINSDEKIIGSTSNLFNMIHISASYPVKRTVGIGVSMSILNHKLYKYSSSRKGVLNIGVAYAFNSNVSLGINFRNLAFYNGGIPWQVETGTGFNAVRNFSLPYKGEFGASYKDTLNNKPILISLEEDFFVWYEEVELDILNSKRLKYWYHTDHIGLEIWAYPVLALRAGYDNGRIPIGFGVKKGNNLINYSFCFERNGMGYNHNFEFIWQY